MLPLPGRPIEPGPRKRWPSSTSSKPSRRGNAASKDRPVPYSVEPFDEKSPPCVSSLRVGMDNVSAVSDAYEAPFRFRRRI